MRIFHIVLVLLSLSLLFVTTQAAVALEKIQGTPPSFCDVDAQFKLTSDPYFEPAYFKWGKFSGKCAGLFPWVRVPKVLSPEEASYVLPYRSESDVVIANVYSRGVLYLARVPLNAKVKVSVVKDFFRYPAAHGTLLFQFEDPNSIQLVPQARSKQSAKLPSKFVNFLSYNLTGVLVEGDPLSLEQAFYENKRVTISRVVHAYASLQEFSDSTAAYRRQEIFPLTISSSQASQILAEGIRHAVRRGYSDSFSGLNYNCIYDMFQVIDQGLGLNLNEGALRQWWDLTAFFQRLPFMIESLLEKRGLWKTGQSKMILLRQGTKL